MTVGAVTGPFSKEGMVCQYPPMMIPSNVGVRFGNNPFDSIFPTFLAQIVFIFWFTRIVYTFLKPLRQSILSAQVVAGIIMGPTILGRCTSQHPMQKLFPMTGKVVLQTAANVGFNLHLFLLGIRMDASMLKKVGGSAALIGTMGYAMPFTFAGLTYYTVSHVMTLDRTITTSIPFIIAIGSISTFPVITSHLADLQILNSELGRLATYISIIGDLWSFGTILTTTALGLIEHGSKWMSFWALFWITIFVTTIIFIFRPFIIWLTKSNSQEETMRETHFIIVLVIVMACGFSAEVIGLHAAFGSFLLGVALPDGPPLGSALVQKLDTIATGLLLPVFIAISGLQTDLLSAAGGHSSAITELFIVLGYIGKFMGTLLPALFCGLPYWEAVTLALIMCCKGVIEVAAYIMWKDAGIIDDQVFALLLVTMLIVSGVARPMVAHLYDPAKRYMAYGRRTMLESHNSIQLRILICVHQEDNVPTILSLLDASNSTRLTPISIFVLHLMELTGSAAAVLVPHLRTQSQSTPNATGAEHTVSAFRQFEQQHQGNVAVQHFTAIAPYASMHNDICSIAQDKRTTIVILPFHKRWAIDGRVGLSNPSIRTVNIKVIKKAPCSVGVLIDRGQIGGKWSSLTSRSSYRVGLLFFSGADDLEAFAYGRRMAQHPHVNLTVIRFLHECQTHEKKLEDELICEYRANALMMGKNRYKEKIVGDGVETTQAIHAMEGDFDLVIVGRYHEPNSPFIRGLSTEWCECPELGLIGDILASSDSQFSVLVVQQQPDGSVPPGMLSTVTSKNKSFGSKLASEFSDGEDFTPDYSKLVLEVGE
ncbi:hypothetical protein CIPAW_14G053600 [Carya illinoinensis]|nr:hypothetical protein CIPAW_14G053600 [Carya illinoinensis]